jgi:hypothetical protein
MSICEQKREKRQKRHGHTHSHTHTLAPAQSRNCPACASSLLHRDGLRYPKDGKPLQRWLCLKCGLRFSEPRRTIFGDNKTHRVRDRKSPQEKELTQSLLQNRAAGDKCTTERATEVLQRHETDDFKKKILE